MTDETERSCQGKRLCKAETAKNKNKVRQIKMEGNNFSLYLKAVKKKIIKGTNLHFSSPINRDSQI